MTTVPHSTDETHLFEQTAYSQKLSLPFDLLKLIMSRLNLSFYRFQILQLTCWTSDGSIVYLILFCHIFPCMCFVLWPYFRLILLIKLFDCCCLNRLNSCLIVLTDILFELFTLFIFEISFNKPFWPIAVLIRFESFDETGTKSHSRKVSTW